MGLCAPCMLRNPISRQHHGDGDLEGQPARTIGRSFATEDVTKWEKKLLVHGPMPLSQSQVSCNFFTASFRKASCGPLLSKSPEATEATACLDRQQAFSQWCGVADVPHSGDANLHSLVEGVATEVSTDSQVQMHFVSSSSRTPNCMMRIADAMESQCASGIKWP